MQTSQCGRLPLRLCVRIVRHLVMSLGARGPFEQSFLNSGLWLNHCIPKTNKKQQQKNNKNGCLIFSVATAPEHCLHCPITRIRFRSILNSFRSALNHLRPGKLSLSLSLYKRYVTYSGRVQTSDYNFTRHFRTALLILKFLLKKNELSECFQIHSGRT